MSTVTIQPLRPEEAAEALPDLIVLLQDGIENGASIGFVLPLQPGELAGYWNHVMVDLAQGKKEVLVARTEDGTIVGSVQLALETRANGRHRAEIQKLLVHSAARRQGIATRLMQAVEEAARIGGRSLLVLDTNKDSPAEVLYEQLGYTRVGSIPGYSIDPHTHQPLPNTIFYRLLDA